MKALKHAVISIAAILFALFLATPSQAQTNDTLQPVATGDIPDSATFFRLSDYLTNGGSLGAPWPFLMDTNAAVYSINGSSFIVDDASNSMTNDQETLDALALLLRPADTFSANLLNGSGRFMGMDAADPDPGDAGTNDSGGGDYTPTSGFSFDTNSLWIELTNVLDGTAFLNLHNATDQVYAIWSTTTMPGGWNVESELWPTNSDVMPFTELTLDRQSLFLMAEDWTGVTENGNTTPDWWFWKYFGTTGLYDTNLDSQGNTLLFDYQNGLDPNIISFSIGVANNYVNSANPTLTLGVTAGTPAYYSILVDSTNFAGATWSSYTSSNVIVNLGPIEGWHQLWVGLKGPAPGASETWKWKRLKLDTTAPSLVITNPTASTFTTPAIQVFGYCPEALASISYDLSNAAGWLSNRDVSITGQFYCTNTWELTTNYFECHDVPLTNGLNTMVVHLTDLAGNIISTNISFTLDYSTATNPAIQLTWPKDGMQICQSTFTLRGWTEDSSAHVMAQIVDTNSITNIVTGYVERTGVLWVENLPLSVGTNQLTLTVTNSAGLSSMTNISLVKSDIVLVLTNTSGDLWLPTVTASGLISDPTATIWVNGVQATNNGDGTWSAINVPVSSSGVASFDMQAIPAGGDDPNASANVDKPDEIVMPLSYAAWTASPLVPDDEGVWTWYTTSTLIPSAT